MSTERADGRAVRHILIVIENVSVARDHRVRKQVGTLRAAGYRVSVICRRDPDNRVGPGARLYEYRAPADARSRLGFLWEYGYSWLLAAVLAGWVFVTDRFDAIQISGTPDIYFLFGVPLRWLGVRLILDQRDLTPELYELRYGRRGATYRLLRWLERRSYRSADHVVTVNDALRDAICRRGGRTADDVTVVRNGPVLAGVRADHPAPKPVAGKRFLCCWAGLMGPQDGLELALRAIAELPSAVQAECRFVFIGDGEYRETAERLVSRLDLARCVDFPGWLPESELFGYLAAADLGLEPNLEETVSPVKGMEYMAFGLPYVAFDTTETRRMSGAAARYVPRGDVTQFAAAIAVLLGDEPARRRMGRVGRERVEREFAWEHQETAYLSVLDAVRAPSRDGDRPRDRADVPATRRPARPTPSGRVRSRIRAVVTEHPSIYLPFARHKYPGPSPEVVSASTELVIDGYTRSGSTAAVYAFQLAQSRPVRVAHHLHAPAQLIGGVRAGLPVLLLIRQPRDALLSQLVREPGIDLPDVLFAYRRFHACLLPYVDGLVVADFDEVVTDFGAVIRRLNARFGTGYRQFRPDPVAVDDVYALARLRGHLSPVLLGFESGRVGAAEMRAEVRRLAAEPEHELADAWVPSVVRDRRKRELLERWYSPALQRRRRSAEEIYRQFAAHAAVPPATVDGARR